MLERLTYFDNQDCTYCPDCAYEDCDGEVTEFLPGERVPILSCDACGKEIKATPVKDKDK